MHLSPPRTTLLCLALTLLLTASASAQFIYFPRLGVSASPTEHVPVIEVQGQETFELYVLALPPANEPVFQHEYGTFSWLLLEACCGGSAVLLNEEYNPALTHAGGIYSGVVSSSEECMDGEVAWLCTLTLQMNEDASGFYYVLAAPAAQAVTCGGDDVTMTDMLVTVDYTAATTPSEATSWSSVKSLFGSQ